jgi:hypothetical protein
MNLDSAFCNWLLRLPLLNLFAANEFVYVHDNEDMECIGKSIVWLFRRHISFPELMLCGSQVLRVIPELMALHWDDQRLLKLTILQDKDESFSDNSDNNLCNSLVADLINKHQKFTSFEIRSEEFVPGRILQLVDTSSISRLTSLKLPLPLVDLNDVMLEILSEHCSNLVVLEIPGLFDNASTLKLQTLLLKNVYLVELSLLSCAFSTDWIYVLSQLVMLNFLSMNVWIPSKQKLEASIRQLGMVCSKLEYFELKGANVFVTEYVRFYVDKRARHHHKMYISDNSNSSPLWLHSFSSSSVKTLTLFRAENLTTAFLDAISVRLPALEVLTFEDMRAFSSKLPKMVSECVGLTTINIKDCAGISVDNLLELISANKDLVNVDIDQDTLTVEDFQKVVRRLQLCTNDVFFCPEK